MSKKAGIYIVTGGFLKTGLTKVGKTDDYKTLRDRYNTYYGDKAEIKFYETDDYLKCEDKMKKELKKFNVGGEIFEFSFGDADKKCKEVTGVAKCRNC